MNIYQMEYAHYKCKLLLLLLLSSVCQADATDIVTDSDKSVNLKTVAVSPGLTEDEIMHVFQSRIWRVNVFKFWFNSNFSHAHEPWPCN